MSLTPDAPKPKKLAYGGPSRHPVVPNPYMRKSIAWLLAANALRDKPLPDSKISAYAGHPPRTVANARKRLFLKGLFTATGKLCFDSPLYKALRPAPSPLPDLSNAVSHTLLNSEGNDADLAPAPTEKAGSEPPNLTSLSPERGIEILTRWVESGAAGKDAPKFISQIMELRRHWGKATTPPAPRSDEEVIKRLVAILDSVPPELLTIALERVHDLQATRTAPPSEAKASDGPADPVQEPSGPSGPSEADRAPEPDPRGPLGDSPPRVAPLGASS